MRAVTNRATVLSRFVAENVVVTLRFVTLSAGLSRAHETHASTLNRTTRVWIVTIGAGNITTVHIVTIG